ncbi:MAG: RecQ family ATP-dependent DNA helicase [Spirochaetales bacterium]|nr:RecQ family ATP-dependent DNA helicase [Spirochaetales bacterium]
MDEILQCAKERFGIDYLFPYQRLVISNILEALRGADEEVATRGRQIVILPTGAGKSLCFQLPVALVRRVTLIIYPLLSLMNDQQRRMREAGFSVVQLRGGQERSQRERILAEITDGAIDFVLTNPETLCSDTLASGLKHAPIAHAVVDEAHCISEWGDSFREAYTTIGSSLDRIGVAMRTAFTATASDRIVNRIRTSLFGDEGAHVVRANPDRPNITYSVVPTLSPPHALTSMVDPSRPATDRDDGGARDADLEDSHARDRFPVWSPGARLPRPAVIFCRSRSATETIAALLRPHMPAGRAMYYHAGLSREEKQDTERRFFESRDGVLAATCAYGMGVDKGDIRSVVHTYLPETAEAFLQESGRAGRDRDPAVSIVLLPPEEQIRYVADLAGGRVTPVQEMAMGRGCRRATLLRHLGVEDSACTGCDRCATQNGEPPTSNTAQALLYAIGTTPVPLTPAAWVRIFRGRLSHADRLRGLSFAPGRGILVQWSITEVERALQSLTDLGLLYVDGRGALTPRRRREPDRTDRPLPFRPPQRAPDSSPRRIVRRWWDGLVRSDRSR